MRSRVNRYNGMGDMKLKPTPASFLARYLSSLTPLLLFIAYSIAENYAKTYSTLILISIIPITGIAWTLRNREASYSLGLFTAIVLLTILLKLGSSNLSIAEFPYFVKLFIEELHNVIGVAAVISSLLVLAYTEIYRRTISYEVGDDAITMSGGLLKKQYHSLPYDKIGRVILEQSVFGRLFNYGTVIPVGIASWGEEYYTRAIGGGLADHGAVAGLGYARTIQEISRDPLKVLYGVPNPKKVYDAIRDKLVFTYKAEKRKLELLESIDKKLGPNK